METIPERQVEERFTNVIAAVHPYKKKRKGTKYERERGRRKRKRGYKKTKMKKVSKTECDNVTRAKKEIIGL